MDIKQIFLKFRNSELVSNLLKLVGGGTIAQLIPFFISPILTRLYKPEDFATYALFLSVVNIVEVFSTGMYERAVMLPKEDRDGFNIVKLMSRIVYILFFIVLICILFLNKFLCELLNFENTCYFLLLLPLAVSFVGLKKVLVSWIQRKGQFPLLAKVRVLTVVASSTIILILGLLKLGALGFVVSYLLSLIISLVFLLIKINYIRVSRLYNISYSESITIAKMYIRFPLYSLPQRLLLRVFQQLPIFFINSFYSQLQLGFFSFANRVVNTPVSEISMASQSVFYKRMQELSNNVIKLRSFAVKVYIIYSLIIIMSFAIVLPITPDVFDYVFGSAWRIAGEYVQVLALYYISVFSVVPLVNLFYIAEANKYLLIWEISRIGIFILFYFLFSYYGNELDITYFLFIYSCIYFVSQLFLIAPLLYKKSFVWKNISETNLKNENTPNN